MLLEILQRLTLGHVIGEFLKITKPELSVLPVNITKTFHVGKLQSRIELGNDFVLSEPQKFSVPASATSIIHLEPMLRQILAAKERKERRS